MFGRVPACAVVAESVAGFVESREGAVGEIWEELVVPAAIAPAGMASDAGAASATAADDMAAANLDDFTGLRNVDEARISHHPDG